MTTKNFADGESGSGILHEFSHRPETLQAMTDD
jgi:hypothetical protein